MLSRKGAKTLRRLTVLLKKLNTVTQRLSRKDAKTQSVFSSDVVDVRGASPVYDPPEEEPCVLRVFGAPGKAWAF